eukprot:TRINITY_DN9706_c0_g1_i1.p1 TRINITY_DN9706_c0_g1~~TRINITY_DN9706_c0_g1_i1.p1  ORF type:complete len:326 (+),score=58.38 TRINITY_DN9706_c0_g1_i1:45-1022(+)
MRQLHKFESKHKDVVNDIAYDFYGLRLATASTDTIIKIWERQDEKNEWVCTSVIDPAHKQCVNKICWAHPSFGQILASCSTDTTVCLWEEKEDLNTKEWVQVAKIPDSHRSVDDVKFSPYQYGLRLAACSQDGVVRFYEAIDVTALSSWFLYSVLDRQKEGVKCVTWCPFGMEKMMVATGSRAEKSSTSSVTGTRRESAKGKVWEYNEQQRKWILLLELSGHTNTINDIAWAPNIGRSYHLIATASKDTTVCIWKIQWIKGRDGSKPEVKQLACFQDHNAEVWRVEWNVTGTILASSGDDGCVRLWRANPLKEWKPLYVIRATER